MDLNSTLCETILYFNDPERAAHGKRRKCRQPAFSSLPIIFSVLSKTGYAVLVTLDLSFCINVLNVDRSKTLVFSKELTLSLTSPTFYVSAAHVFGKHCGKRRNCS